MAFIKNFIYLYCNSNLTIYKCIKHIYKYGSIIITILFMSAYSYAEIEPVSVSDVQDHQKISSKLNEIINHVNKEMNIVNRNIELNRSSKASILDVESIKSNIDIIKSDVCIQTNRLNTIDTNLKDTSKVVGDPTGTTLSVTDKFKLLLKTLDKAPTPQHKAVTP